MVEAVQKEAAEEIPLRIGLPSETAPSELKADDPSAARFIGMIGVFFSVFGVMAVYFNYEYGPRLVGTFPGMVIFVVGIAGMLFHASRDDDMQVRRVYGLIGVFFQVLAIALALIPFDNAGMGARFLPYGALSVLTGLFFLLPFARHETDPFYQSLLRKAFLFGGWFMAFWLIGTALIEPSKVPNVGLVLGLLGLFFVCAFVNRVGIHLESGYRAALGLGVYGAALILYALGRTILPDLFVEWGWLNEAPKPFLVPGGALLLLVGAIYAGIALGILSDNPLIVLTRRELLSYFVSPIAFIVLFGVSIVGWIVYSSFVGQLIPPQSGVMSEPILRGYLFTGPAIIVVVFVVPILTMRLLSEEKRSGTLEVLLTAPVGEAVIVWSKFLASLIFFLTLWAPWGLYLVFLWVVGGQPFDYRPMISFYLALAFTGGMLLSMGLFFSSLTRNQIASAILTFMALIVLIFSPNFVSNSEAWRTVTQQLVFLNLWDEALNGRLMLRALVLQGTLAVFWLFLTIKVLEARRWG